MSGLVHFPAAGPALADWLDHRPYDLPETGEIYLVTHCHHKPFQNFKGEEVELYAVGFIDFNAETRVFGRFLLENGWTSRIGDRVKPVPVEMADGTTSFAFTLAEAS